MSLTKTMEVTISKKLAFLLRHNAVKEGLKISPDGYVLLDEILQHRTIKKIHVTQQNIQYIVQNSDKQRYQITQMFDEKQQKNVKYIRATQGHSMKQIKTEELLKRIVNPFSYHNVIHGTYAKFWDSIKMTGLKRMSRLHIHFAPYVPGYAKVISGMRKTCDLAIEINLNKAIADGVQFFISQNSVILTEGVNKQGILTTQYFSRVTDLKTQSIIAQSPLDYIMVLDFEANCTDDPAKFPLKFNEIIQFPVVIVDMKSLQVCDKFHYYIKPKIEPKLTPFCTKLTSITQDKVDEGIYIEQAMHRFHLFLIQRGYLNSHFTFLTCGDYDLNGQMKRQAQAKNFPVPNYLRKYINLKKVFPAHKYNINAKQVHYIKENQIKKPQVTGMQQMLELLNLKLQGTHHSGIDDAMNLARVVIKLAKDGKVFGQKDIHCSNYDANNDYSIYDLKLPLVKTSQELSQQQQKKDNQLKFNLNVQQEKSKADQMPSYSKDPCKLDYYENLVFLNIQYNYRDDNDNSESNNSPQAPIKIESIVAKLDMKKKQLNRASQFQTFIIPQKLSNRALSLINLEEIKEDKISQNMEQALERFKVFLGTEQFLGRRSLLVSNQYDVMTLLQAEKAKPPKLLYSFFDIQDSIRCHLNRGSFQLPKNFFFHQNLFQLKTSIVNVLQSSMQMEIKQIILDTEISLAKVQLQLVQFIIRNNLHTVFKFMKSV